MELHGRGLCHGMAMRVKDEARPHADKAWWEAAFQSENVLDREAVKEAMSKL